MPVPTNSMCMCGQHHIGKMAFHGSMDGGQMPGFDGVQMFIRVVCLACRIDMSLCFPKRSTCSKLRQSALNPPNAYVDMY